LLSRDRAEGHARRVWAKLAALALLAVYAVGPAAAGAAGSKWVVREKTFPRRYTLINSKSAHWAGVLRRVTARSRPEVSSSAVARLGVVTSEWTQNIVLVIRRIDVNPKQTWYEVRLPILPNNSTGWVPRNALGDLHSVHTHLYVNRAARTATLKRDDRTIFTTRVGVGRPSSPTPAGQFYIRDEVTNFDDPFYGPIAFGTSARSAALTDWPGGAFVGIHGTNKPQILPGAVSHGCIRMVNGAIIRLSHLMRIGTPLTIS